MLANRLSRPFLTGISSIAIAVALPLAGPATADDYSSLPAVSGVNAKISGLGGAVEDEGLGLATGSFSVPLSHDFGLQLDGIVGTLGGDVVAGGAIHLFRRDPGRYLLGLYADVVHNDFSNYTIGHVGVEGALYVDNWTFEINGGWQVDDGPAINDEGYVIANAAYYVTPDLKIFGGYRFIADISMGAFGFEYQLQTPSRHGVSVFAEGRAGDNDDWAAFGGVRLYFGDEKSLIARHREDDPPLTMVNSIVVVDPPAAPSTPTPEERPPEPPPTEE